jgi:DNA/RNA endonuclease YhcR with UshA esterase domain
MRDREVISLSLAVATLGLVTLSLAASAAKPEEVKIAELSDVRLGALVEVSGEVVKVRNHEEGHVFLRIDDGTGEVKVAIFRNIAGKVERECLIQGAHLAVVGRVEEYRGELEVVPREGEGVRCLS